MPDVVPVRFARPVGWTVQVIFWWGECPAGDDHRLEVPLRSGEGEPPANVLDGAIDSDPPPDARCDKCGAELDTEPTRGASTRTRYDTPSGGLEAGCLYWDTWSHVDGDSNPRPCPAYRGGWSNCGGRHLMAVLPNGAHWDIDSRASNCGRPDDATHRCWTRHGDPENDPGAFHVDKSGDTCTAGAGSIVAGDWHGFLHHGALRRC